MKHIIPHLWFDTQAQEAAKFYTTLFPNSHITGVTTLHDTPSGDTDIVRFELNSQPFMAINAGPVFSFNPSISFTVNFDPSRDSQAREHLEQTWKKLSSDGKVRMELQKYDFSELYGWIEDRYGLSWQLILTNPEGEERPFIIPSLLFTNEVYGKAKEAREFYLSVFQPSQAGALYTYPAGVEPDKEGAVMLSDFKLLDTWFSAMESAREHAFQFNEAISFIVNCESQSELDHYWSKLSAVPESEQCGWLKDKYGLSWQVVPNILEDLMNNPDEAQRNTVTQAIMEMKKIDFAALEALRDNRG